MNKNKIMLYNFWLLLLGASAQNDAAQLTPQKTKSQALFSMETVQNSKPLYPAKSLSKPQTQSLYVVERQKSAPTNNKPITAEQRSFSENDTAEQTRIKHLILDVNGYLNRYSPHADKPLSEELAEEYLNNEQPDLDAKTKKYILREAQYLRELKSPKTKRSGEKFYPNETLRYAMSNSLERRNLLPPTNTMQKSSSAPNDLQPHTTIDKDSDPSLTINI